MAEMYGPAQSAQVCPPGGLKILNSRSLHYETRWEGEILAKAYRDGKVAYDDRKIVKFVRHHSIDDVGKRIQTVKPRSEKLWHDIGRYRHTTEQREDDLLRAERRIGQFLRLSMSSRLSSRRTSKKGFVIAAE